MIELECKVGPCSIKMKTDSALHPEILESLITELTIKTSIVYGQMMKTAAETGVLVVDEDE